jgi:hypothetical protein
MPVELMVLFSLIGLYAIWVLLPLVPAILIYRLFPSTAVAVSGPLAHLTVRASGAFAAYLVVFLVTYPIVGRTEETIGGFQHPFWTIKGHVQLVDKNGTVLQSEDLLKQIVVRTNPEPFKLESYLLRIDIPQHEELPWLVLRIPTFGENVIDLAKPSDVAIDNYKKTIEIKTPIIIKEASTKIQSIALQPSVDRGEREMSAQAQ